MKDFMNCSFFPCSAVVAGRIRRPSIPIACVLGFLVCTGLALAQTDAIPADPNPLKPTDTSSPRATFKSFSENINLAIRARRSGAPYPIVHSYFKRVLDTFDFSNLPARERSSKETETALFLKEVLDRISLPPVEQIPGPEALSATSGPLETWAVPDTSIVIMRIESGARKGEYLFSKETVDRLPEFYRLAKHLPYNPGAAEGIFDEIIHSPGIIVPRSVTNALPDWSKTIVLDLTVWQWTSLLLVGLVAASIVRLFLRAGMRWDQHRQRGSPVYRFGTLVGILLSVATILVSGLVVRYVLAIFGDISVLLGIVLPTLIFIGLGWFVYGFAKYVADIVVSSRNINEQSIDSQFVRTVLRLASLIAIVLLFIFAADYQGIPLTPVLAGLGVGGLAVALAVRPTLENILGGLTLFADQPVRIGDFCKFGEDYGTVEEIGLRSTRLRKHDDSVVSIPNSEFSQRELTNISRARRRLYRTTIGLRYETTPEQLRYIIAKMREMLIRHPKVSPDKLHVRFHEFGAYSLDIEIFAYIRAREWLNYRAIREDINLRIMDIVTEGGSGFAFPSQTAYVRRDDGIDEAQGKVAETAVEEWRSKNRLPFPEFADDQLTGSEDTLDYPPIGSPNYKSGDDRSGDV